MTRYDVICPSAPWENTTTDQDRAWDLCYDLSVEVRLLPGPPGTA
jgi:hypothetical protein